MKRPNLGLAPTVICFGENNLKERIISIMNFKKPTALTTALSALLVVGIGSTAAFAVAPKTEDPMTVSDPLLAVTASEPVLDNEPTSDTVLDNDPTDNDSETDEPEPIDPDDELESKYPRGEHSVPIFPEDKNGVYYSESGDVIRVPVNVITYESLSQSLLVFSIDVNDKGTRYFHSVISNDSIIPACMIYIGDEFAVISTNKSIWEEQRAIYRQMQKDGIIPYEYVCFHDLNSLD